ncbi:uncharacterized protein [Spinacia oleracea]|uniref:Reverse transcriptase zinc-binding domain-containing protein n=1 Tax=Spinacia oleracea TaxID=3562 RepID=A0ABM3RH70_SPIOL|nr:uncharacterized protein LOC130469602 [Spinacia oleracea]
MGEMDSHCVCENKIWVEFTAPAVARWVVKYVCSVKESFNNFLHSSQWMISPNYSIKKMYEAIYGNNTRVRWCHLVWNRLSIPKHIFTLWLAMHDRLKTKARLYKIGVGNDKLCPIYNCAEETVIHLYFNCAYGKACLSIMLGWLEIHCTKTHLYQVLIWLRTNRKGDFRKKVAYTAIAALTYCIWGARNFVVWELQVPTVMHTVHQAQADVKGRIQNLLGAEVKSTDREWVYSL